MQGFHAYDVYPKHLPDLLADRPVILFGKWRGSPSGTIELVGQTGKGGDYVSSLDAPMCSLMLEIRR